MCSVCPCWFFFFFNDTATTEIYTLSLHDALPISVLSKCSGIHVLQPCVHDAAHLALAWVVFRGDYAVRLIFQNNSHSRADLRCKHHGREAGGPRGPARPKRTGGRFAGCGGRYKPDPIPF